jgi:tetratricopeptide (TPR) repeat protein
MPVLEQIIFEATPQQEHPALAEAKNKINSGDYGEALADLQPLLTESTFNYRGVDFTRSQADQARFLSFVATYKNQARDNPNDAISTIQEAKGFVDINMPNRKANLNNLLSIEEAGIWIEQGIKPYAREILKGVPDNVAGGEKVYLIAEMDFQEGQFLEAAKGFEKVYRVNMQRPGIKDKVIESYNVLADSNVTPVLDDSFGSIKQSTVRMYREAEAKFRHGAVNEALDMFENVNNGLYGKISKFISKENQNPDVKIMEAKILHWQAHASVVRGQPQTALQILNEANKIVESPHAYKLISEIYQNMN